MYVLKLTDKKYNSWGYCLKGCIDCMGKNGFFGEDSVFHTEEEASQYIQPLLNSGWYRKDITKDSFEIIEVKQYKGLGSAYFTNECFEQFKDLITED